MGINDLVVRKKAPLSTEVQKTSIFSEVPVVNYSLVDFTKYSFEYKINEDVDVRMFESDRTFDSDDFIDADYDDYPMFHPGFYGEKNRVGGLDRHIEDWKRIMA